MIEVRNLKKTYKPKKGKAVEALKGINLKFEERGLVFILGKSGSGKSTLLNLLGGLDKFDEGEIIIKGKSSEKFTQSDFDSYRNTFIGFIFQEYNILNDFTVGANIALAMELQGKKPTKEALNKILEEVDLEGYAGRKPNELSGGQKQRVAIARALIKNPEIIMADEPTGALDSNTGKQVFDTLKKLSRDKLVIVVSHDRDFAEQYGDRVIELADGEVISDIKKYIAKPSNLSEGIDIIEDKIIHIKSGYELTNQDLAMINEYLKNNRNADSFISIDSNTNEEIRRAVRIDNHGNREDFCKTSDENLNMKTYDADKFSLIRSKLPLKNSLKMAFGSLKKKPFRLIMTILLSTVAFTLFGLVNTMSSYEDVRAGADSIIDSHVDYTAFTREDYIDFGEYGYYHNSLLSDEDVKILENKFPDIKFNKMADSETLSLSFAYNLFEEDEIYINADSSYYLSGFAGAACIDEDIIADMGYKLDGGLPKNDNEIVITKFAAESFVKAGYKKDYNQEKATEIKQESNMIGKTITLPIGTNKEYTVVGILDTNYNSERYAKYKEDIKDTTGIKDYIMFSEMSDVNNYSYHGLVFTTQKVFNIILEADKGISMDGPSYGISFVDNTNDLNYISVNRVIELGETDEAVKSNLVMFDEKTELGDNEIILPLSALAIDEDLYSIFTGSTDVKVLSGLIRENMEDIKNFPITMESYRAKNNWITEYDKFQVAGIYIDTDVTTNALAVVPNGFYGRFNIRTDGKYTALLGKMPQNRSDVEALVKYSLDNGRKDCNYVLKNCTSYTIDIVNSGISSSKKVLLYIGIFFAVFAAIMLMNFIATSISYKKREIGILRAVGARGTDVFKIFFNESLIIAVINWLISSVVTGLIVYIINTVCREDYNLVITILNFGIIQLAIMFVISVSVAFVASFIPVYRVSKKKPIEAIRKAD